MSKVKLTSGYRKEFTMKSPIQKRYYNLNCTLPQNTDLEVIASTLEDLCDVDVTKAKDVTEWRITTDSEPAVRDVSLVVSYELGGMRLRQPKMFLPRVKSQHSRDDILIRLKNIFGDSVIIESFQERL